MHRLDCRARGTTSKAVGVCHAWGAAVCHDHTLVAHRVPFGQSDEVTVSTVQCTTSAAAQAA
ncbi:MULTISPECIES: DUF2180 family protein [unclassified Streptomyces]|uniref:DUF2180 family protein n=1 Tax=Streptomyces TaxID=1883 RepID=UPI0002477459|nr:hypothetical protein SMCF_5643 [Streptomyces coelicoflavus ZG0656]MZE49484.1 hypothetical protein [Streptomyces sp. SID5477]